MLARFKQSRIAIANVAGRARQWYGSEEYHRRRLRVFRRDAAFYALVTVALIVLRAWIFVLAMMVPLALLAVGYRRSRHWLERDQSDDRG